VPKVDPFVFAESSGHHAVRKPLLPPLEFENSLHAIARLADIRRRPGNALVDIGPM